MIQVRSNISKLAKYKPPWTNMDRSQYLRLDLNEYTQDTPAHVIEALQQYIAAYKVQMYPDYARFLPTLSRYTGMPEDYLTVTNGSDQGLEIILRAFLNTGDEMAMAEPGFPMFPQIAGVIGATIRGTPYLDNFRFPLEEFMDSINHHTKLIVVINPNNPTGTGVEKQHIAQIIQSFPYIPVLVDEAYYEFTGESAVSFVADHPNLIIARTFSKAFAMAGLRLGYIIAHPYLIEEFNKIRGPFDVNSLALITAEAQINFPNEWQSYVHETMTQSKPYLESFFYESGVTYYPGKAHFMLVKPENRDEAVEILKKNKILVRPMTAPAINNMFRMSLGTLDQTQRFVSVYAEYLKTV